MAHQIYLVDIILPNKFGEPIAKKKGSKKRQLPYFNPDLNWNET